MKSRLTWFVGLFAVLGITGCDDEKLVSELPQCSADTLFDAASGECVPNPAKSCSDGKLYDAATGDCLPKCKKGQIYDDNNQCTCPPGQVPDEANGCKSKCDNGQLFDPQTGDCLPKCEKGQTYDAETQCICPPGQEPDEANGCKSKCDDETELYDPQSDDCLPICGKGQTYDDDKHCICPPGQVPDEANGCKSKCDETELYDPQTGDCLPKCKKGQTYNAETQCVCPPGQVPDEVNGCKSKCGDYELYDAQNDICLNTLCALDYYFSKQLHKCVPVCPCNQTNHPETGACEPINDDSVTLRQLQQNALHETAMAFYMRGTNIQYESARRSQYISPEMATSQHLEYLVCSGFTYAVYKQALGIELPDSTDGYTAYAHQTAGSDSDKSIVYYLEGDELSEKLNDDGENGLLKVLLKLLQPGDLIVYTNGVESGHTVFVDSLKDDLSDGFLIHSTSHYEKSSSNADRHKSTKLDKSLSWSDRYIATYGVNTGTVQRVQLKSLLGSLKNKDDKYTEFLVMRPLSDNNKYKHIERVYNTGAGYPNYQFSIEEKDYSIQPAALCRVQYSRIKIEKTVDVHDGSVVEPGQDMTYTIKIKNDSDKPYANLYVKEELSEFVDLKDVDDGGMLYGNTLAWYIDAIDSNAEKELSYTVTVKDDPGLLGKTVRSSGSVAQIQLNTIENDIAYNLSDDEVSKLIRAYGTVSADEDIVGLEAIQQIYKTALGYDLPLTALNPDASDEHVHQFGSLYLRDDYVLNVDITNVDNVFGVSNAPGLISYYDYSTKDDKHYTSYYSKGSNQALFVSMYSNRHSDYSVDSSGNYKKLPDFFVNREHELAGMILNHYYNGVYSKYHVENGVLVTESALVKDFENAVNSPNSRSDRANMVYPETLHDGDILIYENRNDLVTEENGIYSYIYLDGVFRGFNYFGDDELFVKKVEGNPDGHYNAGYYQECKATSDGYPDCGQNDMLDRFGDLPKLFGKDFYVILRPSLKLKTSRQ